MDFRLLLQQGFAVRKYAKDAIIYEPGMQPRYVYFILSGTVRMVTVSDDGKEFIQGIFKANEYFGEPALMVERPYLAYTIVNQPAEIILVGKEQFHQLIENQPSFGLALIKTLSHRLFYKSMMLEEMANEKAEHRLVTLIAYLMTDLKAGDPLPFTRQELADMTGLRVETVIREIRALANKNLIEIRKGKIYKTI